MVVSTGYSSVVQPFEEQHSQALVTGHGLRGTKQPLHLPVPINTVSAMMLPSDVYRVMFNS